MVFVCVYILNMWCLFSKHVMFLFELREMSIPNIYFVYGIAYILNAMSRYNKPYYFCFVGVVLLFAISG